MSGILAGYKIIDCTIAMAGPFATQRLGDLGADVIKVEPTTGEWQRHVAAGGANGNRINVSFTALNRNKRSLAVDLKSESGKAIVKDLVKSGDVFVQNYRPGVAKRLGVDYESLKAINPRIIYISMSGYGEDGPYQDWPGQDMLLQAMSGAMYNVGCDGEAPRPAGNYLVDAVTAYSAFEAVMAALLHRERTGEGQKVEVNMLDSIIALQMQELSIFTIGGVPQARSKEPDGHTYIRAPYGVFNTADDAIALAFPPLRKLGEIAEIPEFLNMEDGKDSFTQKDLIIAKTREAMKKKTTAQWLALFREADIWAGPVYSYAELVEDPQVKHNNSLVEYDHPTEGRIRTPGFPYKFSASPCEIRRGAPLVGEQSQEILKEMGYDDSQIKKLLADGVIAIETL